MKYEKPFDQSDPNASYQNGNPGAGVAGSIPPAAAIEAPQREIVYAITQSGQTPSASDNTQLWKALQTAASSSSTTVFSSKIIVGGRLAIFNTPGSYSFTLPGDASTFSLEEWGGGGGGGGASGSGTTGAASGGGGGDYEAGAYRCLAGSVLTIVVGSGGAGGPTPVNSTAGNGRGDGGNGALSSVTYTKPDGSTATIVASGGQGAMGGGNPAIGGTLNSGLGGTGTGGLDSRPGASGGYPYQVFNGAYIGGSGGTAYTSSTTPPNFAFAGPTGTYPGGGGGGSSGGGSGSPGGTGANGKVIIRY